jgi:hypothetical protein
MSPITRFLATLMGFVVVRAATVGRSPVRLVSSRADAAFAGAVRARWASVEAAAATVGGARLLPSGA